MYCHDSLKACNCCASSEHHSHSMLIVFTTLPSSCHSNGEFRISIYIYLNEHNQNTYKYICVSWFSMLLYIFIIMCPYIYLTEIKRCICIHQFKTDCHTAYATCNGKCPTDRRPIFRHTHTQHVPSVLPEQWEKCVQRKSNFQSDFATKYIFELMRRDVVCC